MRILKFVLIAWVALAGPLQAKSDPLAMAIAAAEAEDWPEAARLARQSGERAGDIVEWMRLRAGEGTLADYRAFLQRHGDWPGLRLLRRKGEAAITDATPADQVLAYFADAAPQTGTGALQSARALTETGARSAAEAEIRRAWHEFSLTGDERAAFLGGYGELLKPSHEERLDMLLWRGLTAEAEAMLPLVSDDGARALARARIALRARRDGVDALIAAVPAALRNNPGLAYDRFLWRARKGRNVDAAELLQAQSDREDGLGQPQRWASWRRVLARFLMREGKAEAAYRLASTHQLSAGSSYADLEWLSGYLALRKLNDPERALVHFRRFRAAVASPISLGRAGYWEGRAQEALGNSEAARAAYSYGAEYQTSFYGQLAAERAGIAMDPDLTGEEVFADWRGAAFLQTDMMQMALELQNAGARKLSRLFFMEVAERQDEAGLGQLADLALELDEPNIALRIAKMAAQRGHILPRAYYPVHPLAGQSLPIAPELALSIARRESEFDPEVISPAGARGLMQLMPGTAKDVSKDLELEYEVDRLLTDWRYNARLGSRYLQGLIEEFGPSYVLVAAGYNAGPRRPREWIERFGDPRTNHVDVIDWVESIPFRETRNYVMRVMESLPVYRARMSGQVAPLTLLQELRRSP